MVFPLSIHSKSMRLTLKNTKNKFCFQVFFLYFYMSILCNYQGLRGCFDIFTFTFEFLNYKS